MMKLYWSDILDLNFPSNNVDCLSLERIKYLESIKNEKRKKQSYFVWKLLEYVLGINNISCEFLVNENGKWQAKNNEIYFSLSHSENIVAVVIDDNIVGVDIEKVDEKINKIKKKILTNIPTDVSTCELTRLWTENESRYKSCKDFYTNSWIILDKLSNKYVLTVSSNYKSCCDPICVKL